MRDESITEHTEEGARQESTAYDLDSRPSMADLRRAFADGWEQTLRSCVPAVVSIRVNLVASFDTERATSMQVRRPHSGGSRRKDQEQLTDATPAPARAAGGGRPRALWWTPRGASSSPTATS